MPEKIREVRTFELAYDCEVVEAKVKCPGSLLFTGDVLRGMPTMFKHRCAKCGNIKFLPQQYPSTMGLPVGLPIPEAWKKFMVDPEAPRIALDA